MQNLQKRIIEAFQAITPEQTEKAIQNMGKQSLACIHHGGVHFEQYL